jgi:hypothetical protein
MEALKLTTKDCEVDFEIQADIDKKTLKIFAWDGVDGTTAILSVEEARLLIRHLQAALSQIE